MISYEIEWRRDPEYRNLIEALEENLETADPIKSKELLDEFGSQCMMSKELWNRRRKLPLTKMFSEEFYDNLDPTYHQLIIKLEDDLKAANVLESNKLLDDFSSKYMMQKELWDLRMDLDIYDEKTVNSIPSSMYAYQFYYDEEKACYTPPHRCSECTDSLPPRSKIYFAACDEDYHWGYCSDLEEFLIPHQRLEIKMNRYLKDIAANFIPRKHLRKYEKMQKIYDKIIAVENDDEKWFKALLEVDDIEFVEHNVEYRLGINLCNKKLWKMYFEYLKENDSKHLLQTYSKYCRFFLDDDEIKVEYEKAAAAQKLKPVPVLWKDLFDFEINENIDEEKILKDQAQIYKCAAEYNQKSQFRRSVRPPEVSNNFLNFSIKDNYKSAIPQKFAFKGPLINYIIQNANANLLYDIFKTCKWFYVKYSIHFRYNLDINDHHAFYAQNQVNILYPKTFEEYYSIFENVYIAGNFYFKDEDNTKLSSVIPLIYKCTAVYLKLRQQHLTLKELEFLVADAKVVYLSGKYFYKNDEICLLEDILKVMPKVNSFQYNAPDNFLQFYPNTSNALTQLPNKFEHFCIMNIFKGFLEPYDFAEFVTNNVSLRYPYITTFFIGFGFGDITEYIKNIKDIANAAVKERYTLEGVGPSVRIWTINNEDGADW